MRLVVLLAAVMLLTLTLPVFAAQRMVVWEYFTNSA
jgi:hypothetical protein